MSTLVAAPIAPARRARRLLLLLATGAVLVLLAFDLSVMLQTLESSRTEELAQHTYLDPYAQTLIGVVGTDLLTFAGFALAGAMLARLGYRWLWVLPAVIGVFGYVVGAPHLPQPISSAWMLDYGRPSPWYLNQWLGSAVDLILCLAVALPFRSTERRFPRWTPSTADVLAVLAVGVGVAITLWTTMVVTASMPPPPVVAAVCVFAVLAGTSRPWPLTVAVVALGVGGTLGEILWSLLPPFPGASPGPSMWGQVVWAVLGAIPLVLCASIASVWDRLGALMSAAVRRPAWLLVAVNLLNLADALLTQFAVRAGAAVELNPVVRLIGMPAKLVLVGLLSWVLYRRRPATLLIPAAVLLVVLAYHVSGLVIDG